LSATLIFGSKRASLSMPEKAASALVRIPQKISPSKTNFLKEILEICISRTSKG
jgi:hypothetical protein